MEGINADHKALRHDDILISSTIIGMSIVVSDMRAEIKQLIETIEVLQVDIKTRDRQNHQLKHQIELLQHQLEQAKKPQVATA